MFNLDSLLSSFEWKNDNNEIMLGPSIHPNTNSPNLSSSQYYSFAIQLWVSTINRRNRTDRWMDDFITYEFRARKSPPRSSIPFHSPQFPMDLIREGYVSALRMLLNGISGEASVADDAPTLVNEFMASRSELGMRGEKSRRDYCNCIPKIIINISFGVTESFTFTTRNWIGMPLKKVALQCYSLHYVQFYSKTGRQIGRCIIFSPRSHIWVE